MNWRSLERKAENVYKAQTVHKFYNVKLIARANKKRIICNSFFIIRSASRAQYNFDVHQVNCCRAVGTRWSLDHYIEFDSLVFKALSNTARCGVVRYDMLSQSGRVVVLLTFFDINDSSLMM